MKIASLYNSAIFCFNPSVEDPFTCDLMLRLSSSTIKQAVSFAAMPVQFTFTRFFFSPNMLSVYPLIPS